MHLIMPIGNAFDRGFFRHMVVFPGMPVVPVFENPAMLFRFFLPDRRFMCILL